MSLLSATCYSVGAHADSGAVTSGPLATVSSDTATKDGCDAVDELLQQVTHLRGLSARTSVKCRTLAHAQFVQLARSLAMKLIEPSRLSAEDRIYKLLGFIPESFDYEHCMAADSTNAALAFYTPSSKEIILQADIQTPRFAMIHELTHAIQDQHFNLRAFQAEPKTTDEILARMALAEGDAVAVEEKYRRGHVEEESENREQPLAADACTAPRELGDILGFVYDWGRRYVEITLKNGGTAAVDALFRHPPNRTTDILYAGSDRPVTSSETESRRVLHPRLNGPTYTDRLGEFPLRVLLKKYTAPITSARGARGLVEDHLEYRLERRRSHLLWQLRFQSQEDVVEIREAFAEYVQSRFHVAIQPSATDFIFVSPDEVRGSFRTVDTHNVSLEIFDVPR